MDPDDDLFNLNLLAKVACQEIEKTYDQQEAKKTRKLVLKFKDKEGKNRRVVIGNPCKEEEVMMTKTKYCCWWEDVKKKSRTTMRKPWLPPLLQLMSSLSSSSSVSDFCRTQTNEEGNSVLLAVSTCKKEKNKKNKMKWKCNIIDTPYPNPKVSTKTEPIELPVGPPRQDDPDSVLPIKKKRIPR